MLFSCTCPTCFCSVTTSTPHEKHKQSGIWKLQRRCKAQSSIDFKLVTRGNKGGDYNAMTTYVIDGDANNALQWFNCWCWFYFNDLFDAIADVFNDLEDNGYSDDDADADDNLDAVDANIDVEENDDCFNDVNNDLDDDIEENDYHDDVTGVELEVEVDSPGWRWRWPPLCLAGSCWSSSSGCWGGGR